MRRKEAEQKAFDYFQSGFHCAEAVSKTITEMFAKEPAADIPKVASGFGGGIGRSKEDICGALTGGVIAMGCLFGRTEPGEDWQNLAELTAEFRRKFIEKCGSANCRMILEAFGDQENMIKCKKMTAEVAGIVAELLTEKAEMCS